MSKQQIGILGAAALGLLLLILSLGSFALSMSPLEALSSPFRMFVTVRDAPQLTALVSDKNRLDRKNFAATLYSFAASHGFSPIGQQPDFMQANFLDASYQGPEDLHMLVSSDSERISIQVFRRDTDRGAHADLLEDMNRVFGDIGFARE